MKRLRVELGQDIAGRNGVAELDANARDAAPCEVVTIESFYD